MKKLFFMLFAAGAIMFGFASCEKQASDFDFSSLDQSKEYCFTYSIKATCYGVSTGWLDTELCGTPDVVKAGVEAGDDAYEAGCKIKTKLTLKN